MPTILLNHFSVNVTNFPFNHGRERGRHPEACRTLIAARDNYKTIGIPPRPNAWSWTLREHFHTS